LTEPRVTSQAKSQLENPERMLATLISNLPGFVYRCAYDPSWTMLFISEGCKEITGYDANDFINNSKVAFNDIIHPQYQMWTHWADAILNRRAFEHEYPIITATGATRWVWERGRGIFDDNGQLQYLEGFVTDITERKQAAIALAAREEQYRHLFELSPAAIAVLDLAGNFLQVNSAYEQVSGYSKQELEGKSVLTIVPPENWSRVGTHIEQLSRGTLLEHEVTSLAKDGTIRLKFLRERTIPLPNGETGILSIAADVTEQRAAEQALQRSEKKFRSLIEHMLEGMAIVAFTGDVLFCNPAALKMFGVTNNQDLDGKFISAFDFIHSEQVDQAKSDLLRLRNHRALMGEYEYVGLGGVRGWMELYATIIDYDGSEAVLALMRDITERKQEESLKDFLSWHDTLTALYNRRYFERIMNDNALNSPGIIVADLDGLKLINDTLGHQAGDALLKVAAGLLYQSTPNTGSACRIGGDEFAIILPECNQGAIDAVVEEIRRQQDEYNAKHSDLPLSLSLGAHSTSDPGANLFDVFREADNRMYREKLFHHRSSRSTLIHALMGALESKNLETRGHVERIGVLAALVAKHIGLPNHKVIELDLFAKFHDIGKVGVADSILNKPGPLTPEERIEMERHCEIGYRIAIASPELASIADLILKHHEWFNGKGYPLGLSGAAIPIEARIVAIVDAYDAMTSDRPYRKALTRDRAFAEIRRCAGTQFDPELVAAFIKVLDTQSAHHTLM